MSDLKLRKLIYDKYNAVIDDVDTVEMAHIQLVINTVRMNDDEKNTKIIESAINALNVKHKADMDEALTKQQGEIIRIADKAAVMFHGAFEIYDNEHLHKRLIDEIVEPLKKLSVMPE